MDPFFIRMVTHPAATTLTDDLRVYIGRKAAHAAADDADPAPYGPREDVLAFFYIAIKK